MHHGKPITSGSFVAETANNIAAIPLVVAVTGHRDLVPAEIPKIRDKVQRFLSALRRDYPERRLSVLSPLAEGADRLVASVALELNVQLTAVLPMPKNLYVNDFADDTQRR